MTCAKCNDRGYFDTDSGSVNGGTVRWGCDECLTGLRYKLDGMTQQRDRALAEVDSARKFAREFERQRVLLMVEQALEWWIRAGGLSALASGGLREALRAIREGSEVT